MATIYKRENGNWVAVNPYKFNQVSVNVTQLSSMRILYGSSLWQLSAATGPQLQYMDLYNYKGAKVTIAYPSSTPLYFWEGNTTTRNSNVSQIQPSRIETKTIDNTTYYTFTFSTYSRYLFITYRSGGTAGSTGAIYEGVVPTVHTVRKW